MVDPRGSRMTLVTQAPTGQGPAPRGPGGWRGFAVPLPHGLDDFWHVPAVRRTRNCQGQRL